MRLEDQVDFTEVGHFPLGSRPGQNPVYLRFAIQSTAAFCALVAASRAVVDSLWINTFCLPTARHTQSQSRCTGCTTPLSRTAPLTPRIGSRLTFSFFNALSSAGKRPLGR